MIAIGLFGSSTKSPRSTKCVGLSLLAALSAFSCSISSLERYVASLSFVSCDSVTKSAVEAVVPVSGLLCTTIP